MRTAWLVNDAGFEKVKILDEAAAQRKVQFDGGKKDGQTILIPPAGVPRDGFHPAVYEGEAPPKVWRQGRRSLPSVSPLEFSHPEQAKALVPAEEPYTFLPHAMQVMDGILACDHQLLFGPTGVGKTSIILQIAARIGQPVIRLNFNGQVSVSDLVGSVGFSKNGTTWNDGALPRAMRNGYWIVLDEIDFSAPDVLSVLYPVLEAKPKLCLKEHDGEVVEAHPGFRLFATGNSIGGDRDGVYHGTQALNAALLNRFTGHGQAIRIAPMTAKQEREVLLSRLPNLPTTIARRACEFAAKLRQGDGQNPPLLPTFSTRELIQFCNKLLLYRDPNKAASLTFLSVVEDSNVRQPIEEAVRLVFGRRVIIGRTGGGSQTERKRRSSAATTKTPTVAASSSPRCGRVASEVSDPAEVEAIRAAYRGNGGALSFKQIEADPKFNLRAANGNTAFRIIKRATSPTKVAEPSAVAGSATEGCAAAVDMPTSAA